MIIINKCGKKNNCKIDGLKKVKYYIQFFLAQHIIMYTLYNFPIQSKSIKLQRTLAGTYNSMVFHENKRNNESKPNP